MHLLSVKLMNIVIRMIQGVWKCGWY